MKLPAASKTESVDVGKLVLFETTQIKNVKTLRILLILYKQSYGLFQSDFTERTKIAGVWIGWDMIYVD